MLGRENMLTTNNREASGGTPTDLEGETKTALVKALKATLDNIAAGVVLVDENAHILHANFAAREMMEVRSPIVSLGGKLGALHDKATDDLRRAIAEASQSASESGIGLPLVNRDMTAATAHVRSAAKTAEASTNAITTVFVSSASRSPSADLSTIARIFKLSPDECRLLRHMISGATLAEAASALGICQLTVKARQNNIFAKAGVSRRNDLMILLGRLMPPIYVAGKPASLSRA
jgi:DNA-binding CsgD family transcriptional regulator